MHGKMSLKKKTIRLFVLFGLAFCVVFVVLLLLVFVVVLFLLLVFWLLAVNCYLIALMLDIYKYTSEANRTARIYKVAAIL